MKKYLIVLAGLTALLLSSCGSAFRAVGPQSATIELVSTAVPDEHFDNLNRGIDLAVVSEVQPQNMIDNSELNSKVRKLIEKTQLSFTPSVKSFVESSMNIYMRRMGIKVNSDKESDYRLRVTVKEFKLVRLETNSRTTVVLEYALSNNSNERIFSKVARGRYIANGTIADAFDKAYARALADIDWQEIADALTTHKRADQEGQRQVKGDGDTALEHTIIRWYIDSSPKGADVSWRVISSTPDVKNTNSTYVGTTPYETTESFDIRGMKFENSGNIQIEITCEKPGYLSQKRRFNLRQVIEQKEISAKFNLIKDED